MTEAEWLEATDPKLMLTHLADGASDRKLRLIGCAACRVIWDRMLAPESRAAVEASEQYADGLISERELDLRSGEAEGAYEDATTDEGEAAEVAATVAYAASYATSPSLSLDVLFEALEAAAEAAHPGPSAQAELIRCIFGNPFRPVTADPSWLTSTVTALARGIYADRAFDRLPILADALQDAGCDHPDILAHCRSDGPHARGCWVVDLVLGLS